MTCGNGLEWSKNESEETSEEATVNIQEEGQNEPRELGRSRRPEAYFGAKFIKFAARLKLDVVEKRTKTKGLREAEDGDAFEWNGDEKRRNPFNGWNQKFYFKQIKFKMPVIYPTGNVR